MDRGGAAGQRGGGEAACATRNGHPEGATRPKSEKTEWRLWVDDPPRPGWANMAIDQTLLDRAEQLGESWLRLYSWEPHCLSFGRHEPASRRYDADRIAAMGLDTVRRPTGGRAVWHSRELTYAVAAPCRYFGSLQAAYLEIHRMLAGALRELGVPASLASRTAVPRLDAGPCFVQPAGGEVMTEGRKVVGSAQLRRGGALLQHGSILLQDEQQLIAGLMKGAEKRSALPAPLNRELSAGELVQAIVGAVQVGWSGRWHGLSDSDEVLRASSRHYPQFRSPAWTWER
ncbi:MAG: biotin/lipoate A/B protein ligase family protein [Gemmatimonadales bacterium]